MSCDSLGDRMKGYENVSRIYLLRRLPVIIRVDGRAFHTFTRGFSRPFDAVLQKSMYAAAKGLCEQISGVKLAYVQSDEISLLLTNDDALETQPWFDNNLQKLVSISASIATMEFNRAFIREYSAFGEAIEYAQGDVDKNGGPINLDEATKRLLSYQKVAMKAQFDARAFVIPPSEVTNYFIWRQQDATRNSVQMVARSLYSHKELMNKNTDELQEMIFQKGINWNDYPTPNKRGFCVVKKPCVVDLDTDSAVPVVRNKWVTDTDIPVFTQDRDYIERLLKHDE